MKKNIFWLIFIALLLNIAVRARAATETDTDNDALRTLSDAVTCALVRIPAMHAVDARIVAHRASGQNAPVVLPVEGDCN